MNTYNNKVVKTIHKQYFEKKYLDVLTNLEFEVQFIRQ